LGNPVDVLASHYYLVMNLSDRMLVLIQERI
jgi:hypothetical protein